LFKEGWMLMIEEASRQCQIGFEEHMFRGFNRFFLLHCHKNENSLVGGVIVYIQT